jgi:flagellar biosynthesis/type III secretory pathway chaperone
VSPDVAALVEVLREETKLARELVEALQEDQRRILDQDIGGLEESNRGKEAMVLRFESLERGRREATVRLAQRLGINPDEARLSTLFHRLGPEGTPLQEAAESLRAVLGSLKELVEVSRGFLEQSVLGIRGLLSLIQSLRAPAVQTYDASGRFAGPESSDAVVVRKEA